MTPEPDARLALRLLIANAWRRRRTLAIVGAVAALPLATLSVAMAPRFVSTSQVVLLLGPEYAERAPPGTAASTALAFDADHILGNESAILDSDDLHRAVIRAIGVGRLYPSVLAPPGIAGRLAAALFGLPDRLARALSTAPASTPPPLADPVERALAIFDGHFDAAPSKGATVLTLRFSHRDPLIARDTLRALERLYLAQRRSLYVDRQVGPLRDEAARARRSLDDAEQRLGAFRVARNVPDYPTQLDILLREDGDLRHDMTDAQRAEATARARIDALAGELRTLPATVSGGQDSDLDAQTASTRSSLDALRARRADILARYRADSPEAATLADEIGRRDAERAAEALVRPLSALHTVRNGPRDAVQSDLLSATASLGADSARADADADALDRLHARIDALGTGNRQLQALVSERDAQLDAFRSASAALAAATRAETVERDAQPGVRIADAPNLPARPRPLRLMLLAAATVAALFATGGGLVLLHVGRHAILLGAELERAGLRVLARVPDADPLRRRPPIRPLPA